MQSEDIKAAVTNLKRHDQWWLRGDSSIPELLIPAWSIPEQEAFHQNQILCQIYAGEPIHSRGIVIGKVGYVDLIRRRISEEGEFVCSVPSKVKLKELAEYVSPNFPEAEIKFLNRLNSGRTVSVSNVKILCQVLSIDMDDVAFAVPTVYTTHKLPPVGCASLWAEPWNAWVDALDNGFGLDVPRYNIYFNPPTGECARYRVEIKLALNPIYNALVDYLRAPVDVAKERLRTANNRLRQLGFDCWVSYRWGLRVGEPNHRSKLFLTIAKIGFAREVVALRGYVRFDKIMYFDLLPKPVPYTR